MINQEKRKRVSIKVERRLEESMAWRVLALLVAFVIAFLVSGLLLKIAGADIIEAFGSLFAGSLGGKKAIMQTLATSTPLILTGVAVALAFRGRVFNIGAEGQLFAGAMAAYGSTLIFAELPRVPLLVVVTISAFVGGAICGLIPAILKARFRVDVILSTVMLNYVVGFVLSYLISGIGPWRDPVYSEHQSPLVIEKSFYPILYSGTRLHVGFIIAILAAVIGYLLLRRMPLGYEIRAIGLNDIAALFKGISPARIVIVTMLISGGVAGLAGATELFGVHHRLQTELSFGFGFTGIIIAMLGGMDPLGAIPAAFLFGALNNGAFRMQVTTGVPTAIVSTIQSIILLFFLVSQALVKYRVRIEHESE